ncbi:MAG TPA: VWA domain-containing protein [Blastocatellia bacterium]|nr:VWA domain-containing protein [Blastocatellia bacterium]
MRLDFTNPSALLLLALVPVAIYVSRKSLANLSTARAAASVGVRTLLLMMIVLAISGLRIRTASRDLALIFLVDVSASIAQENRHEVIDFINGQTDRAGPRDYVGIVAFAREPLVELSPTRKDSLGDWHLAEITSNPPRDYTDVAAALRLASALVPQDANGRFVLISDGNENLEDAARESEVLRASGIEVYTRAIATTSQRSESHGEIAIRSLDVPEKLAQGEAFDLRVTVDATVDTDATLRVFRNGSPAAERSVHVAASGENVFALPQRLEQKGFYTYRAEVEAIQSDTFTQNNAREAFAVVEGRPRTLYLFGDAQPSPAIARVLAEGEFAADVRPASAAPAALAGFQDYDLVIFDNVPASAVTTEQMKMVRSYVRDLGGGFIMIGGDHSFGPGGYYKTPIAETLPVSLDVREKKHLPSLALALVIDKSGSMEGTKMELTREAASAAVDFLSERDSVGVIAFDSAAFPVVNLTKVGDKPAIIRQIESIQALGGTNMYPGLRTAYDWLRESDAQIKHIIVLSDGRSEGGDFRGIARQVREAGMTLTSVAVGDDADLPMMKMIADIGGGRFYQTSRPDNLPRIFTREASLASRTTIIEEPFVPRLVRPTQATSGIDWSSAPHLGGYVGTAERDSLKSPAVTSLISDKDDPVYAVWQYGLGRAGAFTSDAKSRWAASWMNWPGFGQFWTQALREILRGESTGELAARLDITAGRGHLSVEATTLDGEFKNNLRLRAQAVAPDFSTTDIALDQTAAGLYEGDFPAISRGAYLVSVLEDGGQSAAITGAVNSYSPEFNITSADADLLSRISNATGGSLISGLPSDVDLFGRRSGKTTPHEMWELLLLGALLLLPVDIGLRRVHLTREQAAYVLARLRSILERRTASPPADATSADFLAQLKDARLRVRLGDAEKMTHAEEPRPAKTTDSTSDQPAAVKRVSAGAEGRSLGSRLLDARRKRRQ